MEQLIEELKKLARKAIFDMDEEEREHGDDSIRFLWIKSRFETLEQTLWFLNEEVFEEEE